MSLLGKIAAVVLVVILVLVGALWYYGSPPAADTAKDQGWSRSAKTESYALVNVQEVQYQAGGSQALGGAYLVTAPAIPLLDMHSYVPGVLKSAAAKQGLTLSRSGTQTVSLVQIGGMKVPGTLYDVTSSQYPGVSAKALEVDFACPDGNGYVIALGYGIPGSTYGNAVNLVENTYCR